MPSSDETRRQSAERARALLAVLDIQLPPDFEARVLARVRASGQTCLASCAVRSFSTLPAAIAWLAHGVLAHQAGVLVPWSKSRGLRARRGECCSALVRIDEGAACCVVRAGKASLHSPPA